MRLKLIKNIVLMISTKKMARPLNIVRKDDITYHSCGCIHHDTYLVDRDGYIDYRFEDDRKDEYWEYCEDHRVLNNLN